MHIFINNKNIFCCYQNILTIIMYLKALNEDEKKLIYFFFFLESRFSPSIKETNLDNIYPKIGTQIFSYKYFMKI